MLRSNSEYRGVILLEIESAPLSEDDEMKMNSLGNACSQSCGGKDLQKRKVLSREWKSEGVMEN